MTLCKWHQGAFPLRTSALTLVLHTAFLPVGLVLLTAPTSNAKRSLLTNGDADRDLQNEGVRQDLENDLPLSHDLTA